MTPRIAATSAIAVALAAPAVAAGAPVLEPLRPCYVVASPAVADRQAVTVSGSGFTPGAAVDVALDGEVKGTATADATGALPPGTVPAPWVAGADRFFSVVATEQGSGLTVSREALVTRLRVRIRPEPTRASKRVRFAGSGFVGDAPVFAHYLRGGAERHLVRMARRPDGACGTFAARRRLFPFSPGAGRWTIQFDQQRRYERRPETVFYRLRVTISER